MKIIRAALLVLLAVGFLASPSMGEPRIYYGHPVLKEGQNGKQWVLEQEGLPPAILGTFENNRKVQNCLQAAFEQYKIVKLSGNWQMNRYQNEHCLELDTKTAQCKIILKEEDCPDTVLYTVTIDAINRGVSCGDFCHFYLLPEYGDEFDIYADPDEVEKLLGTETGNKVQVTYNVKIGWLSYYWENPVHGVCTFLTEFKSGKVLGEPGKLGNIDIGKQKIRF